MYKKILFVGDLRTAYNYGAIATTEALMDLVEDVAKDAEIRYIDARYFWGNAPQNGYQQINYKEQIQNQKLFKNGVKNWKKKTKLHKYLTEKKDEERRKLGLFDTSPTRYDMYDFAVKKIKNGEMWQYEKSQIEWAEVVIVNSEGNIVNGIDKHGRYRHGGRYVLFFEYLTKVIFNKPCYVINHTVDPKNRDIKKIISEIYPLLDSVCLREKKSIRLLNEWGIQNAKYVPDALWSHDFETDEEVKCPVSLKGFDFSKPYICIGDSSGILNRYSTVKWNVVETYTSLITQLRKVCPNIIFVDGFNGTNKAINKVIKKNKLKSVTLSDCNYHELFYVLRSAKVFISGRWHASIISLMAKTPIVLWGADSHKTEALYDEIGYNYEFFDIATVPLNIDRIAAEVTKVLDDSHEEVWKKVAELKKLSRCNVDMLRE